MQKQVALFQLKQLEYKDMTTITVMNESIGVFDAGYDTNGNRRYVVHYITIASFIALRIGAPQYACLDKVECEYRHALAAMARIGGKRFHNRKYGGGISFAGANLATLGAEIEESIDTYCRWYNSENVSDSIVKQIADRMRHRLSIVVKSTNSGYVVTGEYSNGLSLRVKCAYDHTLTLTEAPLKAALLWAAKAEYKYWQLNGQECHIKILSDYTALDANTRVYHYELQGY